MVRVVLGCFSVPLLAGTGIIGVAVSDGPFQVNQAMVDGNANLKSGSVVQTLKGASQVNLLNGSNLIVGKSSQITVHDDRVVLNRGTSQFASKNSYALEALGFRVAPEASSQIRVEANDRYLVVSVVNGGARVSDKAGMPVARLVAGRTVGFQSKGEGNASSVTGRVSKDNGKFLLADEASGLTVQLNGNGLDREVGRRIQVSGTAQPTADRSTQIIEVARANRLDEEASPSPSPSSPNPTPSPKPAAQFGSTAVLPLILGLAAVGAGAGIIYATSRDPSSP